MSARSQMMLLGIGPTYAEIDRTLGTNIGNMTLAGGLAASFDGITNHGAGACSTTTGTTMYVGKTGDAPRFITSVIVYGSNNAGFNSARLGGSPITLTLYGKQGAAPSNSTDGTSLAASSFTDAANESGGRTLTSSQPQVRWDHWWVTVTKGDPASNGTLGELRFFA